MKKAFIMLAAICCSLALNATIYTCHIKVVVNGTVSEQDEVPVVVTGSNGVYDLSLNNFCLSAEGFTMPVGNIAVSGVEGVDEYGYTTIKYNNPITITPGNDGVHSQDEWIGPLLGEVPIDLTARFTGTALDANIDIVLAVMGQTIGVSLFGVAPAIKGDVNDDGEVSISDVNSVIDIILSE
jgi:hypothetical protein